MVIGRLEILPILLAAVDLAARGKTAARHGRFSIQHLSRRREAIAESGSGDVDV